MKNIIFTSIMLSLLSCTLLRPPLDTLKYPHVVTEEATDISSSSFNANGIVNANNLQTVCYFEYGTAINYGNRTTDIQGGSDIVPVEIKMNITGLEVNKTYHYRLVATNSSGTSYGNDVAVKTLQNQIKPTVETKNPSNITNNSFSANGTVNPNGLSTEYFFEYGTTINYDQETSKISIGNNSLVNEVSATISGLNQSLPYCCTKQCWN